jgi:hypothetical protein
MTMPIRGYDAWKLMTPEDDAEAWMRCVGRTKTRWGARSTDSVDDDRDYDDFREDMLERERLDKE